LVWAHAEYLKLLRSATDGRVYDRIPVVAERYGVEQGKRTFTNHIEIFEVTRPVTSILAGYTLRIVDREHFRVVYTLDSWVTTLTVDSRSVGYPGSFADIVAPPDRDGVIEFTLAWPGQDHRDRWLGRNIDVAVIRMPESKGT